MANLYTGHNEPNSKDNPIFDTISQHSDVSAGSGSSGNSASSSDPIYQYATPEGEIKTRRFSHGIKSPGVAYRPTGKRLGISPTCRNWLIALIVIVGLAVACGIAVIIYKFETVRPSTSDRDAIVQLPGDSNSEGGAGKSTTHSQVRPVLTTTISFPAAEQTTATPTDNLPGEIPTSLREETSRITEESNVAVGSTVVSKIATALHPSTEMAATTEIPSTVKESVTRTVVQTTAKTATNQRTERSTVSTRTVTGKDKVPVGNEKNKQGYLCDPNPCMNGGICFSVSNTSFACSCPVEFTGDICQIKEEDDGRPCIHANGTVLPHGATWGDPCSQCYCDDSSVYCDAVACAEPYGCTDIIVPYGQCCPVCVPDGACASFPCENGGSCGNHQDGFYCVCRPGYTGAVCDADFDECVGYPCRNNGTCVNTAGSFFCVCDAPWYGALCEQSVYGNSPCHHYGVIYQHGEQWGDACSSCHCDNGKPICNTVGCEYPSCSNYTYIDGVCCPVCVPDGACASFPCQNGGYCESDLSDGFNCYCTPGFIGDTCDEDYNECVSSPCLNNGTCFNTHGSFICACDYPWFGALCEQSAYGNAPCHDDGVVYQNGEQWGDACTSCHCDNGMPMCIVVDCAHLWCSDYTYLDGVCCPVCVAECAQGTCLNGGTCIYSNYYPGVPESEPEPEIEPSAEPEAESEVEPEPEAESEVEPEPEPEIATTWTPKQEEIVCACPPGYTGSSCEQDIDECASQPCFNLGTCIDHVGGFSCTCLQSFSGQFCELWQDFGNCYSNQFRCNDGYCLNNTFVCDGHPNCEDGSDENDCGWKCGGHLTVQSGDMVDLHSSNFPMSYNNLDHCVWYIRTSRPNDTLSITLFEFRTESCCDYVIIGRGSNFDDPSSRITTLSGYRPSMEWTSIAEEIYIVWHSDGSVTDSGWHLETKAHAYIRPPVFQCYDFTCRNATCAYPWNVCNGISDCYDGTDESFCDSYETTTPYPCSGQFQCSNGWQCIPWYEHCDGSSDCYDGSDEWYCHSNETTTPYPCYGQHQCSNGWQCYPYYEYCNGNSYCYDGSDEWYCATTPYPCPGQYQCSNAWQCYPYYEHCNGNSYCNDGSDERYCDSYETTTPYPCSGQFQCSNGWQCIPWYEHCDGSSDCYDGSDERYCHSYETTTPGYPCHGQNQCNNGWQCYPYYEHCNGNSYCSDGSDEWYCATTPYPCYGQHQCSNGWQCYPYNEYCNGNSYCYDGSDEWYCGSACTSNPCYNNGTCNDYGTGYYCTCEEGFQGQYCEDDFRHCLPRPWYCYDGNCIKYFKVCDNIPDCADFSDEMNCTTCAQGLRPCGQSSYECIPEDNFCDGYIDCFTTYAYGYDEADCEVCLSYQEICDNGETCLETYMICNNEVDCADGTDELNCDYVSLRPQPDISTIEGSAVEFSWEFIGHPPRMSSIIISRESSRRALDVRFISAGYYIVDDGKDDHFPPTPRYFVNWNNRTNVFTLKIDPVLLVDEAFWHINTTIGSIPLHGVAHLTVIDRTCYPRNPCMYNGTCEDVNADTFSCTCQPGYRGDRCEISPPTFGMAYTVTSLQFTPALSDRQSPEFIVLETQIKAVMMQIYANSGIQSVQVDGFQNGSVICKNTLFFQPDAHVNATDVLNVMENEIDDTFHNEGWVVDRNSVAVVKSEMTCSREMTIHVGETATIDAFATPCQTNEMCNITVRNGDGRNVMLHFAVLDVQGPVSIMEHGRRLGVLTGRMNDEVFMSSGSDLYVVYACSALGGIQTGFIADAYAVSPDSIDSFILVADDSPAISRVYLGAPVPIRDTLVNARAAYSANVTLRLPVGIALDGDFTMVYWSDLRAAHIARMSLTFNDIDIIAHDVQEARSVVVDPISRLLFWLDANRKTLEVASLDDPANTRTLLMQRSDISDPRNLVVDPINGYLYGTASSYTIWRSFMDGTNGVAIFEDYYYYITSLTMDYSEFRLYFYNQNAKRIETCNTDGEDRRIVTTLEIDHIVSNSLVLDAEYFYLTETLSSQILRVPRSGTGRKTPEVLLKLSASPTSLYYNNVRNTIPENDVNICSGIGSPCQDDELCIPVPYGKRCIEISRELPEWKCGGQITVESGGSVDLFSSNYPFSYNNSDHCVWYINASNSDDALSISVVDFNTELNYDYVIIGRRSNPDNTYTRIATLHGNRAPIEWLSVANEVYIVWHSDGSINYPGWHVQTRAGLPTIPPSTQCKEYEFTCSDGSCISQWYVCDGNTDCPNTDDDQRFCNIADTTFAPTTTPNYNCQYYCSNGWECIPAYQHCNGYRDCSDGSDEWYCGTPTSSSRTQAPSPCPGQYQCHYGYQCIPWYQYCDGELNCNDGSDERYCGYETTQAPCPYDHQQCLYNYNECIPNVAYCNGTAECSDASDERGCPCYGTDYIYVQPSQTIILTSPNYPYSYNNGGNCIWIISAGMGGVLLTRFAAFHTESSFDRVTIGFGSDPYDSNTEIISASGSTIPDDWRSPGSQIWVKWYSDSSVTYSGWNLTISHREGCFNTISLGINDVGYIKSPNYPDFYGTDEDCTWIVKANYSRAINVHFIDFDTQFNEDFLSAGQGDNPFDEDSMVFIYSGTITPVDWNSESNLIWLRFTSDSRNNAKGFHIELQDMKYCENLGIPQCERFLPYGGSAFYSHLGLDRQAAMERMDNISTSTEGCHDHVDLFMCTLLSPECGINGTYRQPCFSFCDEVRTHCEEAYSHSGYDWPVNCSSLPTPDEVPDCVRVTPCMENPCVNGGTCLPVGDDDFICSCTGGYAGQICDEDIDECASNPCQNDGLCFDLLNEYICVCPYGYQGLHCDCVDITIEMCRELPLNMGRLGKYSSGGSDRQASPERLANELERLRNDRAPCHEHMDYLMCGLFAPECSNEGPYRIPCRSYCQEVRRSCEPKFLAGGIDWPIDCDLLPSVNDSVHCIRLPTESGLCGTRLPNFERIVGGSSAALGEVPWQVSLLQYGSHHCGGSVISKHWILTAAHCVEYTSASAWTVKVGFTSQASGSPYLFEAQVARIVMHPSYNSGTNAWDLALMYIDEAIEYNDYVRPICLPPADDGDFFRDGQSCLISGWGDLYHGGSSPDDMQVATIPLVSQETCRAHYGYSRIQDNMICAYYPGGGVDTCQGDSGGPVACQTDTGRWYLAGVTSWGDGCAQNGIPGVYARVTAGRSWINEVTNDLI